MRRTLREPLVHFFAIGALLFFVHRFFVGDPRTIAISSGVEAELVRRFQDLNGRKPEPAELEAAFAKWKRDEALFREALRAGLDRDDSSIRAILVDKMVARAALEVPKREPTDAELQAWLASNRARYEAPTRYDFEFVTFPKAEPGAPGQLDELERAIRGGANPAMLGRPVIGGNLSAADMKGRVEPELAERIPTLPPRGAWQRVETQQSLVLARVKNVEGGLPGLEELRPTLRADWSFAARQRAIEEIVQRTVDRYHFEERP